VLEHSSTVCIALLMATSAFDKEDGARFLLIGASYTVSVL